MKYFKLKELSNTNLNVPNTPDKESLESLISIINEILDPLREHFNTPITITSGYRSVPLNRLVGGSKTSQHLTGEAIDFKMASMKTVFYYIIDNFEFDQLIWEYGTDESPAWIHISSKKDRTKNRGIVLREFKVNGVVQHRYLK